MPKKPANALENDLPATLVTGGARRIGRAIVEDLAAHGYPVAIHCNRSGEEAEAVAAAIRSRGGRAAVVRADLAERKQIEGLVGKAAESLGQPIRLLVNNASIFEPDTATSFDWQRWDVHFTLHVEAPVMLARRLVEGLPAESAGLVVNLIDQRVLKPTPRYFSYMLSKSTLWTATQTMAQALAPRVRVNAIAPGPTLPNASQTREDFDGVQETLLLKRGPELAEFGATVRYLWGAKSITGQLIAIDGGQHLAWETPDAVGAGE